MDNLAFPFAALTFVPVRVPLPTGHPVILSPFITVIASRGYVQFFPISPITSRVTDRFRKYFPTMQDGHPWFFVFWQLYWGVRAIIHR